MLTIQILLIYVSIVNAVIGSMVYVTNPRRSQNRQFFVLSLNLSIWGLFVFSVFAANSATMASASIRVASYLGALVPVTLHLLCLSIDSPLSRLPVLLARARYTIIASQLAGLLCFTKLYLASVIMPGSPDATHQFPEGVTGIGFTIFNVYFPVAFGAIIFSYVRKMRRSSGVQRIELQFILLGMAILAFIAITTALVIPSVTGTNQSQLYAPLCIIAMNAIIAYGIATQRIMGVADLLRRAVAYGLLTLYLLALYVVVTWASNFFFVHSLLIEDSTIPYLLAALVLAFSMAPANGLMQRFAQRLFISSQTIDVGVTMQHANRLLRSITTLDELLRSFGTLIADSLGADAVRILFVEGSTYEQHYPLDPGTQLIWLQRDKDPLVRVLQDLRTPLVADTLQRRRTTELEQSALAQMRKLDASVAVGIWSKGRLEGVLLLGARVSGRMYGALEQDALHILCDQLAVAVENARLYTQVQDGKIYNDILLDNLVSGVVAANARGMITIFNREAQRITRRSNTEVLHKRVDQLPTPLAKAMQNTLETGAIDQEEQDVTITFEGGDETAVRVGCTTFRGHAGNLLGVLLVFNDVTKIKKLEMQVRRTDRLASIGTLAAGMAHEIKNPLVTIKTFTQLLPERYADGDFRDTFSSLIGHEVKRIDTIVNQLLNFARPTKPSLQPLSLRAMLEDSLRLVHEQLKQKNITLACSYTDESDMINADADLLEQAFINFFLNAIQSMEGRGKLHVRTEVVNSDQSSGQTFWGEIPPDKSVRVHITDTGKGIASEDVAHVFDPFFTTKSEGTGLGLSVSHGIIQDHGGVIDVESSEGRGTTFVIAFPILKEVTA